LKVACYRHAQDEVKLVNAGRSTAVIITAKNAAGTAAKAVSSALAQCVVSEVVFVDDGSHDGTSAAAGSADDGSGRLRIIRLKRNRGPAHGRNVAIEASAAPYLCILDADDFMSKDRLDRLFERGGDDWDLLADDIQFTVGPHEALEFDRLLKKDFPLPCELTLSIFALGNVPRRSRYRRELGFLKPLIRRSFLTAHSIGYDERLRLGEDLLFYASCLINGARFRIVEACGYYAIQAGESLSGSHHTEDIALLYQALVDFERNAALAGRSIGRLPEYTRSVQHNLAVRRALDAKRKGGWLAFLAALGATPGNAAGVVSKLALTKFSDPAKRKR
jgi:succinoglycan biosynthesis protein ExoU